MKRPFAIISATGFLLFFITIVIIANRGEGDRWWGFIGQIPYGDKLGHLCLTGTMSFLCNLAFPKRHCTKWIPKIIALPTLVLAILLSLEELSQAFIPSRTCDGFDWLADLAGLALGQFAARLLGTLTSAAE